MRPLTKGIRAAALALSALVALACARVPVEPLPELYWPLPPQKPRIKFVDLIMGSMDVTEYREGGLRTIVFGDASDVRTGKPTFVAVNDNVVYVSDTRMIHVYDFNKKTFGLVGKGLFLNASGIDVTSDGTIYAADTVRRKVYIFERGAKEIRSFGKADELLSPGGLAVDEENGRVLIADAKKHMVVVFSMDGEKLFEIGSRGTGDGQFNFPYDLALGPGGRIYVVDSGNFRVQIFDKDGAYIGKFGSVGTAEGLFARPKGIALDSEGHIYVVDAAFGNFQIFDEAGNVFLAVGAGGAEPGMFSLPFGVDIDENDRIYVVDQMNRRVQVFQYLKESGQ
jgi:DNA-binding beta-propeller fold protein YncE